MLTLLPCLTAYIAITCFSQTQDIYSHKFEKKKACIKLLQNAKYKLTRQQNVAFMSESDVEYFHSKIKLKKANDGKCLLQTPAAIALDKAIKFAKKEKIPLTQQSNTACLRSYQDTLKLWNKRVYKNLDYYVEKREITDSLADKIKNAPIPKQVEMILQLENNRKLYFSTYRNMTILRSAAPPGTSDHITGWAFDLKEGNNPASIGVMNKFGFYQIIPDDWNHFVYLGKTLDDELKKLGLKKFKSKQFTYWSTQYFNPKI